MHKKACKQKDGGANKKNDGELCDKQALGQTCVHPICVVKASHAGKAHLDMRLGLQGQETTSGQG